MAKEVIFESEKLEKKQKLMRLLLPLAVLAVIIVIAVIIAVIVGKNKPKTYTGGENTLYPYTWTEKKDGTLTVQLPNPKVADCVWTIENSEQEVADISKDAKPPKGQTAYIVTPKAAGRTQLEIKLSSIMENGHGAQLYALAFIMDVAETDGKLKTTMYSASGRELPGVIMGGETEGWPYQITASGSREIMVYLKDRMREIEQHPDRVEIDPPEGVTAPAGTEWTPDDPIYEMNLWDCTSSDEAAVRVNGVIARDGLVTVWLEVLGHAETSSAEIVLRSKTGGAELAFTVKIAEDGTWSIEADKLTVFEPVIETFPDSDEKATVTAPAVP